MSHPAGWRGRVASLNVSPGGVPKRPVPRAVFTPEGVAGDRQRNLEYHGGEARAVCLYALECIEGLRAEGHPIEPGSLGENVTVAGVDWSLVRPGAVLAVGAARLEVTSFTTPCRTIMRYFSDLRFSRVSHKTNPGWSRVYARVVLAGEVAEGDPVVVLDVPAAG